MQNQFSLSPEEARLIRAALLKHDGETIHPEIDRKEAERLTAALDKLRLQLLDIADPEVEQ